MPGISMKRQQKTQFPILNLKELCKRLESRKGTDREYTFEQGRSEDYVTWNLLPALQRRERPSW